MEMRRESRQEVVFGGRRWGRPRGTVTSLCLLSVGGPAGEGTQKHQHTDRNKKAKYRESPLRTHSNFLQMNRDGNLPQSRERLSALLCDVP